MNEKALLGLVKSRLAYRRDWPECVVVSEDGASPSERIFDLSEALSDPTREIESHWATVGRNLPFPIFAIVGNGGGVCIISGDDTGLYCYAYAAPIPMIYVRFTADGWQPMGILSRVGGEVQYAEKVQVDELSEALGMMLTLIQQACDNTRHVVSYRLSRAERRRAMKEGAPLDALTVHHVCLTMKSHAALTTRRGATVVPTPKRLHEVRAHWRRLGSGSVVRVRSHRRGQRGTVVLPKIYSVRAE